MPYFRVPFLNYAYQFTFSPAQYLSNRSEIRNKSFPIRNATKGKKHYGRFTDRYQTTLVIYSDKQARRQYFSKLIYFNQTDPSQTMISRKKPLSLVQWSIMASLAAIHSTLMHFVYTVPGTLWWDALHLLLYRSHTVAKLCFNASAFLYSHICT